MCEREALRVIAHSLGVIALDGAFTSARSHRRCEISLFQEVLDRWSFVAMEILDELAIALAEQIYTGGVVVHGSNRRICSGNAAKISAVENAEEKLSEITLIHIT
jgi:hypothetical protein